MQPLPFSFIKQSLKDSSIKGHMRPYSKSLSVATT